MKSFLSLLFLLAFNIAQALPFELSEDDFQKQPEVIELLVNPISKTSEWGHVSIRVAGPGYDKIYDFGRYGHLWFFNGKGDPVLRLWDRKFQKYMEYRTQADRSVTRFVFQSDRYKNEKLLAHFDEIIFKRGTQYTGKEGRWKSDGGPIRNYKAPGAINYYAPALGEFHATDNNCTTISVDAFQMVFDIKINGHREYIQSRNAEKGFSFYDLNFFSRGLAMGHLRNNTDMNREKGLMFWPEDLMAFLMDHKDKWNELVLVETWTEAGASAKPKVLKKL